MALDVIRKEQGEGDCEVLRCDKEVCRRMNTKIQIGSYNAMQKQPAPTPFCYDLKRVKAIVLGADPSNFSDNGRSKDLTKAFGIGDGDARYFRSILQNLKEIGLGLEDVYVDNLIQEYLDSETSKNRKWDIIANQNILVCLKRLDVIDKKRKMPILITADIILKAVISNTAPTRKAKDYYTNPGLVPIKPSQNKLFRPLIPFFREHHYQLSLHDSYKNILKNILEIVNEHEHG